MDDNKIVEFVLQKKAIFCTSIFTLACAVILISFFSYISFTNKITHHFFQDVKITREGSSFTPEKSDKKTECVFEMQIPLRSDGVLNSWELENNRHGAQYDIFIRNKTFCKIKDWKLKLKVPEDTKIDSSWNGFYKKENEIITVTGAEESKNKEILPYTSCKLGFVLYTQEFLTETQISLEAKLQNSPFNYNFFTVLVVITIVGVFLTISMVINYFVTKHQQILAEKEISELLNLCASFIDTRDAYTKRHSINVATYSRMLAEELGYNKEFQKNIYNCGILHDIGKVLIPRAILCKSAKLSDEEWTEMKKHTTYGSDILKDFDGIKNVRSVVLHHHERYDGKGYMDGLKGEEIPLEARIVCVADSFDAMATDRAYRPHLPKETIISEIEKGKGSQFDPKIAQAMLNLLKEGKISI